MESRHGSLVTPAAAGVWDIQLPAANAAAWVPGDLPDLRCREFQPGFKRLSAVLWESHAEQVRTLCWRPGPSRFLSHGYARGTVGDRFLPGITAPFHDEPFRFHVYDFRADGLHTGFTPAEAADLEANLRFFDPGPSGCSAIEGFLAEIADEVAAELRTPWRVLNIRCYRTERRFATGPQLWHRDGFPSPILKLLIYIDRDGGQVDGSELIDLLGRQVRVTGPSGSWLLFDPNILLHRGPVDGEAARHIIEVVLCRDLVTETAFRFGGTNYRHPLCPPGIDLFGEREPVAQQPLALAAIAAAQQIRDLGTAVPR